MKKLLFVPVLAASLAFGQDAPAAPEKEDNNSKERRAAIVSATAAAGAAIGAAVSKDNRTRGAIIGAAAGGLAGLLIDHVSKKNGKDDPKPEQGKL